MAPDLRRLLKWANGCSQKDQGARLTVIALWSPAIFSGRPIRRSGRGHVARTLSCRGRRFSKSWAGFACSRSSNFGLGDLACQVETRYGDGDLRNFADEISVYYSTLRSYKATSKAFPRGSVGRRTHSYGVYDALAGQADCIELVSRERMTVREARELVEKRDTNARRNAARAANKAKKAAEAAKKAAQAAKKASTRRPKAAPPDPAPPEPAPPAPEPRLALVPDNGGDQRQYLGRDNVDDTGTGPGEQRVPRPWVSMYQSAAHSMLLGIEQGRVPTEQELTWLRDALAEVEALVADTAEVTT
jgi:hypothetical protein